MYFLVSELTENGGMQVKEKLGKSVLVITDIAIAIFYNIITNKCFLNGVQPLFRLCLWRVACVKVMKTVFLIFEWPSVWDQRLLQSSKTVLKDQDASSCIM